MNTPIEETSQDGKQRRKSMGGLNLSGGKTRRYSIDAVNSQKNNEEGGKIVPNYLRASTGSCHDFCKYGKKHENSKSSIPIKFKRSTIVNKEKLASTLVLPEIKKTNKITKIQTPTEQITKKDVSLPSKKPQVSKGILSTNRRTTENEVKIGQSSTSRVKPNPVAVTPVTDTALSKKKTLKTPTIPVVKKVVSKTTPNGSHSPKAANLKAIKAKNLKKVSPLKDQNSLQKIQIKKPITDKIPTKNLNDDMAEFEYIESPPPASMEMIDKNASVFNGNVLDSCELFQDKEFLEDSLMAPPVCESSQSSSDKELLEMSLSQPPVSVTSQSSYEEEEEEDVLEEEFEFIDDDEEVSEEEYVNIDDDDEVFETSVNKDEMGNSVVNQIKIPRKGKTVISQEKDEEGVKLRFRRGRILDLKTENNGPRRLKFRRRVIEGKEDGKNISRKTYKSKNLDLDLDLEPEINGPKRLVFRKGKVMEGHGESQRIVRRSFEKKRMEEKDDSTPGPESVVLKHQGEQEKKDSQGLFNNVIEETASKLVETRKSKVKALVGAFETVISLQDIGKPSANTTTTTT